MGRDRKVFLFMKLTLVAIMVIAIPAALYAASRSRPTAVPIQDVESVAGRWFGLLYGRPGAPRGQDGIELTIQKDGTYTLSSVRIIGAFTGRGTVSLVDGRLTAQGEKARVTLTLYRRDSQRFLRAEGTTEQGDTLRADLYPAP
jgi:hypothetical protein